MELRSLISLRTAFVSFTLIFILGLAEGVLLAMPDEPTAKAGHVAIFLAALLPGVVVGVLARSGRRALFNASVAGLAALVVILLLANSDHTLTFYPSSREIQASLADQFVFRVLMFGLLLVVSTVVGRYVGGGKGQAPSMSDESIKLVKTTIDRSKDRWYEVRGSLQTWFASEDNVREAPEEELLGSSVSKKRRKKKAVLHFFDEDENGYLTIRWGDPYGGFNRLLKDTAKALRKTEHEMASLSLIRAFPPVLKVGPAPADTKETLTREAGEPPEHFEVIRNRPVEFFVKINSRCPVTEDEFLRLLHAMEDTPGGPMSRGYLTIDHIERIKVVERVDRSA